MELREIGVETPVREMFAGSVKLATQVLAELGEPSESIDKIIERFVAHDELMLERAQAVFRDEEKLIAMSKSARAELDSILQDDAAADGRSDQQAPERQEAIDGGKRAN
jgi:glutathione-regulated potassium-efflux system ancillary protein KefC